MAQKNGLGRGLSSLIPQKPTEEAKKDPNFVGVKDAWGAAPKKEKDKADDVAKAQVKQPVAKPQAQEVMKAGVGRKELAVRGVPVGKVVQNTQQPRYYFDDEKLQELSASIKEHGILQPLVVVRSGDGYELISGERRLRAAKKAGLTKVPVIVRGKMTEQKKLELAIIENVQRHDLNVIEEGKSYKKLADEFGLSQEEIAKRTGKSRPLVANRMRLAGLPIVVQKALITAKITEGHAKAILSFDNKEKQRALFDEILSKKLTVREAERRVQEIRGGEGETLNADGTLVKSHVRASMKITPEDKRLSDQLSTHFGTKAEVKTKGEGGMLTLHYFSDEEKSALLERLDCK